MEVGEKYCTEENKESNNEVDFEFNTASFYCDKLYSLSRSKESWNGFAIKIQILVSLLMCK